MPTRRFQVFALAFIAAAGVTCAADAQTFADDHVYGYVGPSDVDILFQPDPVSYQPVGNLDTGDEGKSFGIVCTISYSGRLDNCYAEPNDLNDQNFVRAALNNARKWVVGPQLRDGTPSAGQAFRLVCRFDRVGTRDEEARTIASSEDR